MGKASRTKRERQRGPRRWHEPTAEEEAEAIEQLDGLAAEIEDVEGFRWLKARWIAGEFVAFHWLDICIAVTIVRLDGEPKTEDEEVRLLEYMFAVRDFIQQKTPGITSQQAYDTEERLLA